MVKTAVVSWTKCETVLNIILNILVDCFLCSLSNTDWPLKLPLKVANLLINLRVGLFPAWFQLSFNPPSRSWFVPNPILSTFLSSLQNLSLMNFDWYIGAQILVPCLIWDLESRPLFTNHLIWPDWDGIDFRDNRRCEARMKIVVASVGWLFRWMVHSTEFSAVNHLREQLATS